MKKTILTILLLSTLILLSSCNGYTLTTEVSPAGAGSINPVPLKSSYTASDVVMLQAIPNPGYQFYEWSGDATGTKSPAVITMTGNKNVTASFIGDFGGRWATNTGAIMQLKQSRDSVLGTLGGAPVTGTVTGNVLEGTVIYSATYGVGPQSFEVRLSADMMSFGGNWLGTYNYLARFTGERLPQQ